VAGILPCFSGRIPIGAHPVSSSILVCVQYGTGIPAVCNQCAISAHKAHTIEICINFYVNEAFRCTLVASDAKKWRFPTGILPIKRQCDQGITNICDEALAARISVILLLHLNFIKLSCELSFCFEMIHVFKFILYF